MLVDILAFVGKFKVCLDSHALGSEAPSKWILELSRVVEVGAALFEIKVAGGVGVIFDSCYHRNILNRR